MQIAPADVDQPTRRGIAALIGRRTRRLIDCSSKNENNRDRQYNE
jgi:hypothetical protein